ncbi:MAG: hypothetical protein AAGF94_06040 [Pseudomonadota bacterium]
MASVVLIIGAVFAMSSGVIAYRLRRDGLMRGVLMFCTILPGMFGATMFTASAVSGPLAIMADITGTYLFAPASIAAWIGALIGWLTIRQG